ncbi:MAG: hypothetical protein IBX57_00610 [Gammaproteobacteria bacterium]|nr:hypothetical protein [Gammaproteobacteria bacterium]
MCKLQRLIEGKVKFNNGIEVDMFNPYSYIVINLIFNDKVKKFALDCISKGLEYEDALSKYNKVSLYADEDIEDPRFISSKSYYQLSNLFNLLYTLTEENVLGSIDLDLSPCHKGKLHRKQVHTLEVLKFCLPNYNQITYEE